MEVSGESRLRIIRESSGEVGWSAVEVLSTGDEYWEVFLLESSKCHVRISIMCL